ncbi:MAG: pyruvate kinase [Candidatus Omnitrophota bacterium]|nr:pyruvate kinase [Candidatus Omnitrophota bacterium]
MVRTKIIATLGPSSSTYTVLRKMVMAGLDVIRLNFSHGNHKEHLHRLELLRKINKKYRRHIRIMQDLEGYRIRVGRFAGAKQKILNKRTAVWLTKGPDEGGARVIPFDYEGNLREIKPGQLIYIDDGNIILKAKHSSKTAIKTNVVEGGVLKQRKGINMPGARILFSEITRKDRMDIEFGIKYKVDYIAQSFVRRRKDVETIKSIVKARSPQCLIVAKIESREAIKNIDEIIDASDGIMIARGDMGISVPIYKIAVIQKHIIKKCNQKKKFVITATQMLEHMTEHSRPTRAEVADVTNAILDGSNFVMLSAETASGNYPAGSVVMMNQIIKFTEEYGSKNGG